MKKNGLLKIFLLVLVGMILLGASNVFAAEDNEIDIFWDNENVNSTPAKDTNISGTTGNTNTEGNSNTNTNTNSNSSLNNIANTNNTSVYNNTNNNVNNTPNSLSKAGLEDSLPTMAIVVILAISAVYAYKKIKEYRNI